MLPSHHFIYSTKTKRLVTLGQILLILIQICKNETKATFVSFLAEVLMLGNHLCCFWKRKAKNLIFSFLHKINSGLYDNLQCQLQCVEFQQLDFFSEMTSKFCASVCCFIKKHPSSYSKLQVFSRLAAPSLSQIHWF